jgi:hypothetical protein
MFAEENWRGQHMVRGFDVRRAVYDNTEPDSARCGQATAHGAAMLNGARSDAERSAR